MRVATTTDGETFVTEGAGEYAHDDEARCVACTGRSEGGGIAGSVLYIGREKLPLYRDGESPLRHRRRLAALKPHNVAPPDRSIGPGARRLPPALRKGACALRTAAGAVHHVSSLKYRATNLWEIPRRGPGGDPMFFMKFSVFNDVFR
ncbi:hypothetical protein [Pyramidobacter sp. CG50-2]|uniref:hypothetical protein n=1 Tax=Pyramidobacter sp. CG50-2 TaxID=2382160 RepID=UPI000EA365C5|nr:hypothetical protein [Pyramidobacter sp. CG50-2]RKJ76808.1 hypothetical protein D7D26_09590 [Pyramidobacter sp. CG50-2]